MKFKINYEWLLDDKARDLLLEINREQSQTERYKALARAHLHEQGYLLKKLNDRVAEMEAEKQNVEINNKCQNCKYWRTFLEEEPCFTCYSHSKWEQSDSNANVKENEKAEKESESTDSKFKKVLSETISDVAMFFALIDTLFPTECENCNNCENKSADENSNDDEA